MLVKNVEKKDSKTARFQVEVDAKEFDAAVDQAFKKNKSGISIPGFRKGKAPRAVVEGMYGHDVFYQDAIDELVAPAYEHGYDNCGLKIIGKPYTANSASVFVVADAGSTDDFTAYTGVKNAPSINTTKAAKLSETADTYAYCKSGKMITVMFVFPGKDVEINDATSNALFVANGSVSNLIHDNDGDYFTFSAVVDGELKTVKVAQDVKVDGVKQTEKQIKKSFGGLFKSYTTDKGIITSVKTYEDYDKNQDVENESAVNGTVSGIDKVSKEYTVKLGLVKDGEYKYTVTVDKDAKIFYVNTDDEISVSSYSAIAKDDNDVVYAVVKDYMVKTLIVYEQDGNDANPVKPELSKDVEVKSVDIDTPNTTITYYVEAGKKDLTTSDIKAILADKGCKDITKSKDGTWTFTYDGMTFEGVTVVTTQVYVVTFKCTVDKYTVTPNKVTVAAGETVKDLKLSGGTGWTNYSVSADEGTATATATNDLAVTFKWEAPSNLAADTQVTISYQA